MLKLTPTAFLGGYEHLIISDARSLGLIALDDAEGGGFEEGDKIKLKNPERWSAEAANFLEITSWGSLKDFTAVCKRRCLKIRGLPRARTGSSWDAPLET